MGADAVIVDDFIIPFFSLDSSQLKSNKQNPRVNLYSRSNRLTVADYFIQWKQYPSFLSSLLNFLSVCRSYSRLKNQTSPNTRQSNILLNYSTVKSEINSKKTAETTQINGD